MKVFVKPQTDRRKTMRPPPEKNKIMLDFYNKIRYLISTSARQHVSTSARQHVSTSAA